ncbi:hypothetical protein HN51_004589 [Arachis hypogaea]
MEKILQESQVPEVHDKYHQSPILQRKLSEVLRTQKSVVLLGEAVECCTLDGESPVAESITSLRSDPSSMGHVESRVNQQGPPCKAKYSWVTDSEVVP